MYLAVKKDNIFYSISLLKILLALIYPAVYLLSKIYASQAIVDTVPELRQDTTLIWKLYQKGDFFLKKNDERHLCLCSGINAYFKIDKMQVHISTLRCKKVQIVSEGCHSCTSYTTGLDKQKNSA